MLRRIRWIWLTMALLAAGAIAAANAQSASAATYVSGSFGNRGGAINVSYFYQSLAPYGSWFDYPPYGWVWSPDGVDASWRPYSDGEWVYTDYGWTWIDDEPWGWGPMHYGRWVYADDAGWLWVPGTVWGPAWVAWASCDDYVGWAPLPPDFGWSPGLSVSFASFDVRRLPSREWCFVPRRDLASTDVRARLVPTSRVAAFMPRATNLTRFSSRNGAPVNVGVDVRAVERVSGRTVPRVQLVDAQRPANRRIAPSGNRLEMFRGRVAPAPAHASPATSARRDVRGLRATHAGRPPAAPARNRIVRRVPDPSVSAARIQGRQRVDLGQVQGNGSPTAQSAPRQPERGRYPASSAGAVQNRNGYPQSTFQRPPPQGAGDGERQRGDGHGKGRGDD